MPTIPHLTLYFCLKEETWFPDIVRYCIIQIRLINKFTCKLVNPYLVNHEFEFIPNSRKL